MTFAEYKRTVNADLFRYHGRTSVKIFLRELFTNPGFTYSFWLRTCRLTHDVTPLRYTLFQPVRLFLRHIGFKYGISVPYATEVGQGFYIGHFGGIVVNPRAVIGRNCNISHGVTLGVSNRGRNQGVPTIGDDVYIGPGAKIVGKVRIGNRVAVGANCVVTRDVPDDAVVVGIPGRVISLEGSKGYVNHTDYD